VAVTTAVTTLVLTPDIFNTMACQGLPDRPCPWLRCDATVHNTIYDLFLCNKCEKIRDEAKTSTATTVVEANTAANLPAGQRKQRRQKDDSIPAEPTTRRKQSTRSTNIDIVKPVNVQPLSTVSSLSVDPALIDVDQNPVAITELKAEVLRLTDLVSSLSTKLNFVLSYLQLSDDSIVASTVTSTITGNVLHASTNIQQAGNAMEPLFSTVVKTGRKPTNFREAAVSAVYADLRQRDSRKNSIILSGLPSRQCSDNLSVAKLFKDEFDLVTDISVCKRLGQPVTGKIQPLLVMLSNPDHASRILSEAKQLRHSDDLLVRNQVFINPHLTKAEALAAYEQRCQRRLRNKRPVRIPEGEITGSHSDSSVPMVGATASMVMQPTGAEDLPEVFASDAANGHHGIVSSPANFQPVSSGYADNSLATDHSNSPKVQMQSLN